MRYPEFLPEKGTIGLVAPSFGVSGFPYRNRFDKEDCRKVLEAFRASYDYADDNGTWFNKVKEVAASCGFAAEMSDYKNNPEAYKGSVGDVAEIVRIAVTGYKNSPDLWSIMQIIGAERSLKRIDKAIEEL